MAQRTSNLTSGVALITGGAQGLGNAIAVSFASDGASGVALVDISAEDSEAAQAGKRAVEKANPKTKCIYIRTDVTKEEEIERAVQRCVEELGRLDYAANFAGILGPLGTTWETSAEEWRKVIEVNTIGVFLCMKHEMAQMIKQEPIVAEAGMDPARQQQRGSIINAASVNSILAGAGNTGYTASKHAVLGMTKAAALEGRSQGVRVNCISPGFLRTNLLVKGLEAQGGFEGEFWQGCEARQGRQASHDEVGDAVVLLSSPRMSLVNGINMPVDGGFTINEFPV